MHKGRDFVKAQVSNAVMQHRTLLESVQDHAKQLEDPRGRALCERYVSQLEDHQRQLEAYRATLGDESGGAVKQAIGYVLGKAKDAVDAVRNDDFLLLVEDAVMIRQSQDIFNTFATVGDQLGEPRMAEIGRTCRPHHEEMARAFNDLINTLFVEYARA